MEQEGNDNVPQLPANVGTSSQTENSCDNVSSKQQDFFENKKLVAYVKHQILQKYLDAWLPILHCNPNRTKRPYSGSCPQYKRIVYVDGFAGPGVYNNGEPGSPIIAYDRFIIHSGVKTADPEILMIFIEMNGNKCRDLLDNLRSRQTQGGPNVDKIKFMVIQGKFLPAMEWIISNNFQFTLNSEGPLRVPTSQAGSDVAVEKFIGPDTPLLVFIDPFGYSGERIPMTLMRDILNCTTKAEIILNLMTGFLRRFFKLDANTRAINLLVGDDETDARWKPFILQEPNTMEALKAFLKLYDDTLTELCKQEKFTCMFWMRDYRNILLYNLYYVSHHNTGFQRMKCAMGSVTHSQEKFQFSAFNAKKPNFEPQKFTLPELTEMIVRNFKGMGKVSGREITEYIESSSTLIQRYKNQLKKSLQDFYPVKLYGKRCAFDSIFFNFPVDSSETDES